MTRLKVYRIITNDIGDVVVFEPSIPINFAKNEDTSTPRIPCARTIYQCIMSAELTKLITVDDPVLDVCVYSTIVNVENIYEPTIAQVPDVWLSGELWLTESTLFVKEYNAKIRRHMNLPNCAYSRYSFVREGSDEVVDRIQAAHIYGDKDSFSFIDLNPDRCLEALEYAEQHREEYEC